MVADALQVAMAPHIADAAKAAGPFDNLRTPVGQWPFIAVLKDLPQHRVPATRAEHRSLNQVPRLNSDSLRRLIS
jgi:hypothetical protein